MRAFTILTFAITAIATPLQNQQSNPSIKLTKLYTCNGAPYAPLNYTCYDGQLCPVIDAEDRKHAEVPATTPRLMGARTTYWNKSTPAPSNGTAANTTAYLPLCTQARLPCPEDLAHPPAARLPH